MRLSFNRFASRYGVAVATVAAAAWARVQFDALLEQIPFLPFFLAVLVSASYAGVGPGLLATLLGLLLTTLVPLVGSASGQTIALAPALLRFGLASILATILIERVRRGGRELRGERERRSSELDEVNTELLQRVQELQRTEAILRFLAEASESLSALVDYRSTLQRVAALAVPGFADWCAVDMLAEDGSIERLAVAHVDPSKVELAEVLHRRYPPEPDAPYGVPRVLRTGISERVAEITDAMIAQTVPDDERRTIVAELGLRSYLCVALRSKDRRLGAITFVSAESGRHYDERDLAAAEDLARRAEIAIENARLYQELRESDRRKDEFLAVLSHELRNPLAPIRSGLDMMAMDDGQAHPGIVELMRQQVEHLIRLVDDLLDVSRITRGRVELRREEIELGDLLERSAAVMRSIIDQREQTLALKRPAAPLRLDGDPVRLLQVLENLLQNASKFSDPGARIELSAERDLDQAIIRVRDYGIGMDATLLPRLFQPFTQASRTLDRAQGGLGIGLALARGLVELHGGSVEASSAGPGLGSEFVVCLPLPAPSPQEAAPPAGAGAGGSAAQPTRED